MELLTNELRKEIPMPRALQGDDPVAIAKFFCPWNQWTWFVFAGSQYDTEGNEYPLSESAETAIEDTILYGAVVGHEFEVGDFSLNELQAIRGLGGLTIERDLYFRQVPLSKIRAKYDR